jgi:erythromycin esterase
MKKTFTLFSAMAFFLNFTWAQTDIESYVKTNAHKIVTDNPDTFSYEDLEQFGAAIGNKRIVLLGEQSHGDAATFLVKSRLIKYLHEKKGFNVLAFESDFFAVTGGWDKLTKTNLQIDSFMKGNIFPIWTYCQTTEKLFYNYLPQTQTTKTPLQLAGFDCQLHGKNSFQNLKAELKGVFSHLSYAEQIKSTTDTILKYADSLFVNVSMKDKSKYTYMINALEAVLKADEAKKELSEWSKMVIKNLLSQSNNMKLYIPNEKINHYYRDRQMAQNIEWLATQKYPGEKIIIWAHNGHIAKSAGYDYDNAKEENYMMGDFLFKQSAVAQELYVVGFTSYSGTVNWTTSNSMSTTVKKPAKKSLENWVPDDYDFAFINFLPYNEQHTGKAEAFSMKGSIVNSGQHHAPYVHYWTKIFDGVFFIRNMYGCNPVK